jgi:ketopantoate reductase
MADLIEASGMGVIYEKNLTQHTWGITIGGALGAVAAITGGVQGDALASREARLVAAAIIRECLAVSSSEAAQASARCRGTAHEDGRHFSCIHRRLVLPRAVNPGRLWPKRPREASGCRGETRAGA